MDPKLRPQSAISVTAGLKRQTEPTTASPDPKRPRQDSPTKPTSAASSSDPAPSPESATPTTNPAVVPNPPSFASMPPAKQQEFMEKYLKLQSEIKREWIAVQKAQADSSPPEVLLPMRNDLGRKLELYRRLNAILPVPKNPPASAGTAPGPSSQSSPPVVAVPTPATTVTNSNPPNHVPPAPEPTQPSLPPSTATTELQNPSGPNSALPPKEPYSGEAMAQIHRLMQQQNQQSTSFRFSRISFFLPTRRCHHPITHGKQPGRDSPAWPTATMARCFFPGDCEWSARGCHLRNCRVSAELRTVSDVVVSQPPTHRWVLYTGISPPGHLKYK